jgi:hypothetical protein
MNGLQRDAHDSFGTWDREKPPQPLVEPRRPVDDVAEWVGYEASHPLTWVPAAGTGWSVPD